MWTGAAQAGSGNASLTPLRYALRAARSSLSVSLRSALGFILTAGLLITVSPQAIARFKDQVRSQWDARQSLSSEQLRDQWSAYQRGWWAYYRRAEERRSITGLSGWIRRHIRKCFWQRWHSASGRRAALARLGIPPSRLRTAHSSHGAWRMGRHPVLKRYGFITPSDLV